MTDEIKRKIDSRIKAIVEERFSYFNGQTKEFLRKVKSTDQSYLHWVRDLQAISTSNFTHWIDSSISEIEQKIEFGHRVRYEDFWSKVKQIILEEMYRQVKLFNEWLMQEVYSMGSAVSGPVQRSIGDTCGSMERLIERKIGDRILSDDLKKEASDFLEMSSGDRAKQESSNRRTYIHPSRIEELKKVSKFDPSRLVRFCEEVNICFKEECCFATLCLVRSLLNHVPPFFGNRTFSEVLNNYKCEKSFKEVLEHLENSSRKIADGFLHSLAKEKDVLPNPNQVDFSQSLDALLGEIVRIQEDSNAIRK